MHREGLIFLIGRGRGTQQSEKSRVRAKNESRLLQVFTDDQSDSAAISHYQTDIFVKLDFRVRKPATLAAPTPLRRPSLNVELPTNIHLTSTRQSLGYPIRLVASRSFQSRGITLQRFLCSCCSPRNSGGWVKICLQSSPMFLLEPHACCRYCFRA